MSANKPLLEFTAGFRVHFNQISRLLKHVAARPEQPRFMRDELAAVGGLSISQAGNLGIVCSAMGLLKPRTYQATELGSLVAKCDPYFDDAGTLWLCHYSVCSDPRRVIWNTMANRVLLENKTVTIAEAKEAFRSPDLGLNLSEYSLNIKASKEISTFFDAYTDEALRRLNYVIPAGLGAYGLSPNPAEVPPLVLLAMLIIYCERFTPGATGVEIPVVCSADHSPGRICHQDEDKLRNGLERLHQAGKLSIESRANLDQVRFHSGTTAVAAITHYYQQR
jgi:hypothetical protein